MFYPESILLKQKKRLYFSLYNFQPLYVVMELPPHRPNPTPRPPIAPPYMQQEIPYAPYWYPLVVQNCLQLHFTKSILSCLPLAGLYHSSATLLPFCQSYLLRQDEGFSLHVFTSLFLYLIFSISCISFLIIPLS